MAACIVALLSAVAWSSCTSRGDAPGPCGEDYGACGAFAECGGGATCELFVWPFGRGSICLRGCADELDCPRSGGREGRCIDVNRHGDFFCHVDCIATSECPGGWVCQPISSGGVVSGICLP